jgi:hypothetical protein
MVNENSVDRGLALLSCRNSCLGCLRRLSGTKKYNNTYDPSIHLIHKHRCLFKGAFLVSFFIAINLSIHMGHHLYFALFSVRYRLYVQRKRKTPLKQNNGSE